MASAVDRWAAASAVALAARGLAAAREVAAACQVADATAVATRPVGARRGVAVPLAAAPVGAPRTRVGGPQVAARCCSGPLRPRRRLQQ